MFGVFDKKEVLCPPGVWTNLIWNFGSGYAKTFRVRFGTNDGSLPQGEIYERRALWIFPEAPEVGPLTQEMEFHRKWINAFYTVKVKPTREIWAEVY